MPTFLRRALLFLMPMVGWFIAMALVNLRRVNGDPGAAPAPVMATGDSHIGCDLDTAAYPGMRNTALPAEPFLLSWWKIRHLAGWGRIDTLVLGFGPHNLSDLDHRRFKEHGWATDRLMMRMYPLVPVTEALHAPIHRRTYFRTLFMQLCTRPRSDHHQYIGEFSGLNRAFTANADSALNRHFFDEQGQLAPSSETALSALDSIVAFCARERIPLYLVSTPVHETYRARIPLAFSSLHDSLSGALRSRGVNVLRYSDLFEGDSLFADADHLNAKGARLFTRRLRADISAR
ncbi:MAG TPA: hypothetical protein PKY96_02070 [Flavobacteriales bacterium]|nr:hypothetical protein [Flavobacteriales bacterium]